MSRGSGYCIKVWRGVVRVMDGNEGVVSPNTMDPRVCATLHVSHSRGVILHYHLQEEGRRQHGTYGTSFLKSQRHVKTCYTCKKHWKCKYFSFAMFCSFNIMTVLPNADLSSPADWGWKKQQTGWQTVWTTLPDTVILYSVRLQERMYQKV